MSSLIKRKGQIQFGVLMAIGSFIFASMSLSWNAFTKSDKAIEKASAVEIGVAEIRTDVKWIRETLALQKGLTLASSSQPINGIK